MWYTEAEWTRRTTTRVDGKHENNSSMPIYSVVILYKNNNNAKIMMMLAQRGGGGWNEGTEDEPIVGDTIALGDGEEKKSSSWNARRVSVWPCTADTRRIQYQRANERHTCMPDEDAKEVRRRRRPTTGLPLSINNERTTTIESGNERGDEMLAHMGQVAFEGIKPFTSLRRMETFIITEVSNFVVVIRTRVIQMTSRAQILFTNIRIA
jgi:hypothetical protein